MERAMVQCASCGTPGTIIFDDDGLIMNEFFVCRCPRPSVAEANRRIRKSREILRRKEENSA